MAEPFRKSLIEIHSEIFLRVILFQDSPTFELRIFLAQIQKANLLNLDESEVRENRSSNYASETIPKWFLNPPDWLVGVFYTVQNYDRFTPHVLIVT